MASTLFNTNPRMTPGLRAKIIRSAQRIIDGDIGAAHPLSLEQIVKGALAAAGVTGTVTGALLNKLYNDVGRLAFDAIGNDRGSMAKKRLRDDEEIKEAEVDAEGTTTLANPTDSTQVTGKRPPGSRPEGVTGFNSERATKALRGSMNQPVGTRGDENMEEATQERSSALAVGGAAGMQGVSKETPISMGTGISYGLQETHTAIIPMNFWFSLVDIGETLLGAKVRIRLNSLDDIMLTSLATLAAGGTWAQNAYNVPYNASTTRGPTSPAIFPRTIASGASISEKPWWSTFWKKQYEYYTVLGTEMEIAIMNPSTGNSQGVLLCWDMDSYSDTAGATGNITPDATLPELMSFKHMHWKQIEAAGQATVGNGTESIYIKHKPGSISRNISNDGDVKTWTKTDGTLPTLKEILNIRAFRDPLTHLSTASPVGVNISVRMKMIVQFKDLTLQARYPSTVNSTNLVLTLEDDVLDAV